MKNKRKKDFEKIIHNAGIGIGIVFGQAIHMMADSFFDIPAHKPLVTVIAVAGIVIYAHSAWRVWTA